MKRILVVDDDAHARGFLRDLLQSEGFDVVEAADGLIALGVLEKQPVDLVITDRAMPNMSGLELLKAMKKQFPKVPALMVSAYGEEGLWSEAIGLGAEDYLLKPFQVADVMKIVQKTLGKKK